ncbi:hypothetical protein VUR80DRAFT_7931 [Thermomyces stellatus]
MSHLEVHCAISSGSWIQVLTFPSWNPMRCQWKKVLSMKVLRLLAGRPRVLSRIHMTVRSTCVEQRCLVARGDRTVRLYLR